MRYVSIVFLTATLLLSSYILYSQEKYSMDYKIGPRDVLDVNVFGRSELNRTVRVSEDGRVTFPPISGEIEVKGLTKTELEDKLNRLLEERYLQNAQVTVFIREYQSNKVSVLGAVKNIGDYDLLGHQTLLQILARVGGITEDAGEEIIVMRMNPDGSYRSLKIPKYDLLKGDAKLNIPLQANDIINIPTDETVRIYIYGQVRSPGALEFKKSEIPTLLQAIVQAGGFSERASRGGVVVKRVNGKGQEEQIKVNIKDIQKGKRKDFQLQANDIIHIPETIF